MAEKQPVLFVTQHGEQHQVVDARSNLVITPHTAGCSRLTSKKSLAGDFVNIHNTIHSQKLVGRLV
jgi:hypothetical protein